MVATPPRHSAQAPRGDAPTVYARVPVPAARGSMASFVDTTAAHPAAQALRLAWLGLAATAAMIIIAVLARSPQAVQSLEQRPSARRAMEAHAAGGGTSASDATPARPPDQSASDDELNGARMAGLTALGPLAQKYPNDPAVLKAFMVALAGDKAGYASAIMVAKRLFELDPKSAGDAEMRASLLRILNGPPETAGLAFEALASGMGAFGPDLIYELATDTDAPRLRERAGKLLDDAELRKAASPALLVALDLRAAAPCRRKGLFGRARDEGDARALPFLKPLTVTNGCTKMLFTKVDCFECLGNRADLIEAIEAIEGRR